MQPKSATAKSTYVLYIRDDDMPTGTEYPLGEWKAVLVDVARLKRVAFIFVNPSQFP